MERNGKDGFWSNDWATYEEDWRGYTPAKETITPPVKPLMSPYAEVLVKKGD
jgi:hypothetical protein